MKENQFTQIINIGEHTTGRITALYERSAHPDPEGIRRQRNNLATYASNKGFKNLRHYTDNGYAGIKTERPAFQQLMEDVKAGRSGIVIVRDTDRLSREMTTYNEIRNELDLHGIRLIALNEGLDNLPPTITDEKTGIQYDLHGDYYFPVLLDPEQENQDPVGKWGLIHRKFLEEYHPSQYNRLILSGKLMDHLRKIDKQANDRFDTLMAGYREKWNITEALKAEDPMRWVQLMNNAKAAAEWNINMEIVCR